MNLRSAQRVRSKGPALRRVMASVVELAEPPKEAQPWPIEAVPQDIPTDWGIHKWTARSASEVWARYEARGNPLLLDVEHNGASVEGAPAPTAGYARLEMRDGVPWLLCDWSAFGAEQIATKQRRYLSAEYDVDPATDEIIALYRVSLVADPATYRARILASAPTLNEEPMDPKLAAIMAVLNSVDDPAAAIEAIKGLVANLDGDTPADSGGDGVVVEQPAFMSASGDGDGDEKDEDKKPPVAAAAPAKADPKPVAAAAAAPPAPAPAAVAPAKPVAASAPTGEGLIAQNALRDILLEKHGDRLEPSIRIWASTQSLAVVKGLVEAAPEKKAPPAKITATRGQTHGTHTGSAAAVRGLEGAELEQYQQMMGTFRASTPKVPHMDESRGGRVYPTVPPRELQRALAAEAAGKNGGDR